VYHGWNLSPERVKAKAELAAKVEVTPGDNPGEFRVRTTSLEGDLDTYRVVLDPDPLPITRICKHCIQVLWSQGFPLYLVEYNTNPSAFPGREPWELRTEAFWGDEGAVKMIMGDGEVARVTPIERSGEIATQSAFGFI